MGVVQRQSFKYAVVTFAGLALGALNQLFLYPLVFSTDEQGVINFLVPVAQMLFPFAMLGANTLVVRFFPVFREDRAGHQGFLSLVLILGGGGLILSSLAFWVFRGWIGSFYDDSPLLQRYLPYLVPMVAAVGLSNLLSVYSANFHRIAVPGLFNSLYLKGLLAGLALLVLYGVIGFPGYAAGMVLAYASVVLLLLGYLKFLGQLDLRFPVWDFVRGRRKEMAYFAAFGILGSAGSVLASKIDVFMVGTISGETPVAIYSVGYFIADLIDVPRRSIESITAPLVADAWQRGDRGHIGDLYRKSSLNQLILGGAILLCIWVGMDSLFALIPGGERFTAGKAVVLILGIGKLIELVGGINRLVIGYSPRYRFDFYAMLLLAVLNIAGNLVFIPMFAIAGAALATSAVLFIYTTVRLSYIWRHYRLTPFSGATPAVILTGLVFALSGWLLPDLPHPLLNLIVKIPVVGGGFLGTIYLLKLSPELNAMAERLWRQGTDLILRGRSPR